MHKKRTHPTPSGHLGSRSHAATSHPDALPAHAKGNGKPTATEDDIRVLAHAKWQAAGCPPGDGVDFWVAAELELAGDASHDCGGCGQDEPARD